MNSFSNKSCFEQDCCSKQESCSKCHNHPMPGPALLRANTGSLGPTNITTLATLLNPAVNQAVVSTTIDTTCLRAPTVLVQFNGTLTTSALLAAGVTYNFTLYRTCRGDGFREQLKSFSVTQQIAIIVLPNSIGISFAFNQCEQGCSDCCTYTLELTSVNTTVAVGLEVTIGGTLSVLAVDSSC